jgi:hypothetical protein
MRAIFAVLAAAAFFVCASTASADRPPTAHDYPILPPPFVVPPGGHETVSANAFGGNDINIDRADGSLFAHRVTAAHGRVLSTAYSFTDGTGIELSLTYGGPASAHSARHLAASCGGSAQNATRHVWTQTLNWYWNQASTPGNLNLTNTLTGLRNARVEWESVVDWCGFDDLSTMNFTYQGTTTLGYGHNGVNTVGWGNIGATGCTGSNVIACTRTEWDGNNHLTEADTRLSDAAPWANNGALGYYDVQSDFAHETGHAIGFDHVTDSTNVMYPTLFTGDVSNRALGKGDALEDNSWY